MKRNLVLNAILFIILVTGCEKEINVKSDLQSEEELSLEESVRLKSDDNSIYFVDLISPYPGYTIRPEEYSIEISDVVWKYNQTEIIATGTVIASFSTQYGDYRLHDDPTPMQDYARIQFLLAKDDEIFENYDSGISEKVASVGVGYEIFKICRNRYEWVCPESVTHELSWEFRIPKETDLTGVTMVAQGILWACFNENESCESIKLYDADDIRVVFDIVSPFTVDPITDVYVNENSEYISVIPNISGETPIGIVTYALSGVDAADFTINSTTGVVSLIAKDYENPDDEDADNVYELAIIATAKNNDYASETWKVTINDVIELANFSINAIQDVNINDNTAYTSVAPNISGEAPSGNIIYTLEGDDATDFTIDPITGIVSMVARDFVKPEDADHNNDYEVTITATDSDGNFDSESWTVIIDEAMPLPLTPNNLTINESTIILSWDSASFAVSYKIYRKMDSDRWELLATTTNTTYRDFNVINLPDNNTFSYKVQAENSSGVSSYSNIVSTMGNTFH
jgi:hypothetical protein